MPTARASSSATSTRSAASPRACIELCERYGDRTDAGIQIRLPVTQDDLGSWTASSRAGVASALRTMRELGWIETERRRITVLDLDALTQRAAERDDAGLAP